MNSLKGFFYGIATSVTFGLIPLFTLPLMQKGMVFDSILFYRFLFATFALGAMMKIKKESFRIESRDIPMFLLLGLLYTGSAMFLFWGYGFMGAGVATTLHFTYPVFVTLLMLVLFREKASWVTWVAILLAIYGVSELSLKGDELSADATGVIIVLLSAVCYAGYIVAVNKSRLRDMSGRKLAFYVFIVSTVLFAIKALTNQGIQPVPDAVSIGNLFLLAVVPTVQYYLGLGRTEYWRNNDFGIGSHGTSDGRMYRCLDFWGRVYHAGRLGNISYLGSRYLNCADPDHPEKSVDGSTQNSSASCLTRTNLAVGKSRFPV